MRGEVGGRREAVGQEDDTDDPRDLEMRFSLIEGIRYCYVDV